MKHPQKQASWRAIRFKNAFVLLEAVLSRRSLIFPCWLATFYLVWLAIVIWGELGSNIQQHWGIAAAMAAGSYVAGSTPMGGGTVGFPVLVLLFDHSGAMGRDFAFAIQSIGMVSASIYILTRGNRQVSRERSAQNQPIFVDWQLIRPALLGSLISTPLGVIWLAPRLPDLSVKLTFAVIWASFGLMHLIKLKELLRNAGQASPWLNHKRQIGFAVGLLGGLVSSVTGVGIDMLLYATMVLLFQSDLKISTPSSVIVMAFTSVVGVTSGLLMQWRFPSQFAIDPEVLGCWIAAAPVVAIGAPVGAWAVQRLPRVPTLVLISLLCLVQFVWTLVEENLSFNSSVLAITAVFVLYSLFHSLYRFGRKSPQTVNPLPG